MNITTLRLLAVSIGLGLLSTATHAGATDEPRFEIELLAGSIWANGEDERLIGPRRSGGRQIPEISDGERVLLRGQWRITPRWYLRGAYEDARLVYESPLDPACPVNARYFLPPRFFCQDNVRPRVGRIHDDYAQGQLSLGYRHAFGDRVSGFAELGITHAEWDSDDDVEVTALARCLGYEESATEALPVANCKRVDDKVDKTGFVARLGTEFKVFDRLKVQLAWNVQGFRHEIYRNEIIVDFAEANLSRGCSVLCMRVSRNTGGDSWSWVSAQLAYPLTEHVGVVLDLEGGGSRDWEAASLGLRYSF